MANRNSAGFGFRPNGTLGNTPATQGLSQYWIDSAATVDLFNGMAMKSSGGYMITGESATTVTTIGVLYGIYYNAASTHMFKLVRSANDPENKDNTAVGSNQIVVIAGRSNLYNGVN